MAHRVVPSLAGVRLLQMARPWVRMVPAPVKQLKMVPARRRVQKQLAKLRRSTADRRRTIPMTRFACI